MAKIRGVDVLVSIKSGSNYITIGGQKDATLSFDSDTINITTKDDGDWRQFLAGLKSWTLSCDALYIDGDAAQIALQNAFANAQTVEVKMSKAGSFTTTGNAIVTHLEFGAPLEDAFTASVEFQGTGMATIE